MQVSLDFINQTQFYKFKFLKAINERVWKQLQSFELVIIFKEVDCVKQQISNIKTVMSNKEFVVRLPQSGSFLVYLKLQSGVTD